MRNIFITICLCAPFFVTAQWTRLTDTHKEMFLYDVYARGELVLAVGYNSDFKGYRYTSNDYGKTWTKTENGGILLKSVAFINENTGYIGGYGSKTALYRSLDGGYSWHEHMMDGNNSGITDIVFINDKEGFAGGYAETQFSTGNCYSTTDGGTTWTPSDATDPVMDTIGMEGITFLDAQTGFGINNFFGGKFLVKTTNGGKNWSLLYTHDIFIGDIHFWNVDNGILADSYGKIYKTSDGGKTWQPKTAPTASDLNSIVFLNDMVGYVAGGGGTIFSTKDGGETWTKEKSNTTDNLLKIRSCDGQIYASGDDGVVLRQGWPTGISETPVAYKLNIYPNPTSSELNISAVKNCYKSIQVSLVDINGKLLRTSSAEKEIVKLDVSTIPEGIYTLLINADGNKHSEKIVVKH